MTSTRDRESGQALVEFALVAPLLFLLLFGIIEFGRFVYTSHILNEATREGARYAIVHGALTQFCDSGPRSDGAASCDPTAQRVIDRVTTFAIGVIRDGTYQVKVCYPGRDNNPPGCDPANTTQYWVDNNRGSFVKVTLDYQYTPLIPLVPLPPVPMHAESILVINH